MRSLGVGKGLIGLTVAMIAVASCTGPPMPRRLRKFAEVDILAPEVRKIMIAEAKVGSEAGAMGDEEKGHIADELSRMIEEALRKAGYEIASVGGDAELTVVYYESRASPGDAERRRGVAHVSIAVVDEAREEVLYRGYSLDLPKNVPDGMFAFDLIKGVLEEHVGRIFGPGEWD